LIFANFGEADGPVCGNRLGDSALGRRKTVAARESAR